MSQEENTVILVDFPARPGLQQVSISRISREELAKMSADALDSAMATVQAMARRVSAVAKSLHDQPDEVEVEFGITLDTEVGALLAKAGTEAAISVTLTWKQPEAKEE